MLCSCHLPNSPTLFCIGVERFDLSEALQRRSVHIAVSVITELGGH